MENTSKYYSPSDAVSVVPVGDYTDVGSAKTALIKLLSAINGLDVIKSGMRVVIKANLVSAMKPDEAATTHPVLLSALSEILTEMGAEVVIGDSPGGLYTSAFVNRVYNVTGMRETEKYGARLNDDFSQCEAEFPEGKALHSFKYTGYLDKADVIINFCKLKSHGMMGMSCAAKNMFGVIPGTMKPEYHFRYPNSADFARMIVDIDEYFSPKVKLCIADAIIGMEGNGPTKGTPRKIGCIVASQSPHKLDMVCAKLIGLSQDEIPTLGAARERELIPENAEDLRIFGDLDSLVVPDYKNIAVKNSLLFDNRSKLFGKVAKLALEAKPVLKSKKCKGCEKCKQICPAQAIKMVNNKPQIDRSKCIKCFCCQEFCPFGAMDVHRPWLAKILTK